jgi:predicted phosphodiesterase
MNARGLPIDEVAHRRLTRIFVLSDIHVDHAENRAWASRLSDREYVNDVLIVGGDVSCDINLAAETLQRLRRKFNKVFFVPGNHELWIRRTESFDSMAKFFEILKLCASLGIATQPLKVGAPHSGIAVWVVPLFSWYRKPEEGNKSLFKPKQGENASLDMWADDHFIKWNDKKGVSVADIFLQMNEKNLLHSYDAPVISFSHFLPRIELIGYSREEVEKIRAADPDTKLDPHPEFNFSRVAGCAGIEEQIRRLGSIIHAYGHQHRNRQREIDGVRYVSHCLGYPSERESGLLRNLQQGPLQIWPNPGSGT